MAERMHNTGNESCDSFTAGCGVSLVTLREFQTRLGGLVMGLPGEYALVCIGQDRAGSDLLLTVALESLAMTNTIARLSPCLVAVVCDELVCLLPGCSRSSALRFARMFRAAVQASKRGPRPVFGIGVVAAGASRTDPKVLLRFVQNACREAVRRGYNHIEVYEPN